MSASIAAGRRIFLRRCSNILKSSSLSFRKYATSKKTIKDLMGYDVGKGNIAVSSEGWVRSFKKHKRFTFFHINDGTSREDLQVIADPNICSNDLGFGCSVRVEGELVDSPGPSQPIELRATDVQIIGTCNNQEYPFPYKQNTTLQFARTHPHLRPRTEHHRRLLEVRNTASIAVHNFFQKNEFLFVHTPIITSSNCEGAVEMFNLQSNSPQPLESAERSDDEISNSDDNVTEENSKLFFHKPVYMTVSGQLHLEVMTGCMRKVYNFGPTFRAEQSKTTHHLAEFYMIEAEMAFTQNLEAILQVMENLVKDVTNEILSKHPEGVHYFQKQAFDDHKVILNNLLEREYIRMSYTDAIDLLQKENDVYKNSLKWGDDLHKEHEKFLVNVLGNTPVFVTDFPAKMKPFYCRQNSDNQTVAAVDLLVPGVGELFGGSLREERFDDLKPVMDKLKLTSGYEWYLDLRRYGTVPHGGFGMGFERYLQCLLGIKNIKDTISFPRWPQNCPL